MMILDDKAEKVVRRIAHPSTDDIDLVASGHALRRMGLPEGDQSLSKATRQMLKAKDKLIESHRHAVAELEDRVAHLTSKLLTVEREQALADEQIAKAEARAQQAERNLADAEIKLSAAEERIGALEWRVDLQVEQLGDLEAMLAERDKDTGPQAGTDTYTYAEVQMIIIQRWGKLHGALHAWGNFSANLRPAEHYLVTPNKITGWRKRNAFPVWAVEQLRLMPTPAAVDHTWCADEINWLEAEINRNEYKSIQALADSFAEVWGARVSTNAIKGKMTVLRRSGRIPRRRPKRSTTVNFKARTHNVAPNHYPQGQSAAAPAGTPAPSQLWV